VKVADYQQAQFSGLASSIVATSKPLALKTHLAAHSSALGAYLLGRPVSLL